MAATPLGELLIAQSARGLMLVRFLDTPDTPALMAELKERFDLVENPTMAAAIGGEIERLFHGETAAIAARPVDLRLVGSAFQRRALTRLRKVPAGAVTTYQALAAASGSPSAKRAIGNTVAVNPLAIYVPCHRVIKSDGALGNYGGGVERKLKLLRAEGFGFDRGKRVPASTVYGHLVTRIFCRPTCAAAKRARIDRMLIFPDTKGAAAAGCGRASSAIQRRTRRRRRLGRLRLVNSRQRGSRDRDDSRFLTQLADSPARSARQPRSTSGV